MPASPQFSQPDPGDVPPNVPLCTIDDSVLCRCGHCQYHAHRTDTFGIIARLICMEPGCGCMGFFPASLASIGILDPENLVGAAPIDAAQLSTGERMLIIAFRANLSRMITEFGERGPSAAPGPGFQTFANIAVRIVRASRDKNGE